MWWSTPAMGAPTSVSTLSVSRRYICWSCPTWAPSSTSHLASVASVISMPSLGMRISMDVTLSRMQGPGGALAPPTMREHTLVRCPTRWPDAHRGPMPTRVIKTKFASFASRRAAQAADVSSRQEQVMETRTLDTVIYEKDGPVAWIILNYPEKANIQSSGLVFDVDECLNDADKDYDIKVVVIKANGPGFSAGHVVTGSPGT